MTQDVRPAISSLKRWAPLKAEAEWNDEELAQLQSEIEAVDPPVTRAERDVLVALLDRPYEDDIYGGVFVLVGLIESNWDDLGWQERLPVVERPWFESLRRHHRNYMARNGAHPIEKG